MTKRTGSFHRGSVAALGLFAAVAGIAGPAVPIVGDNVAFAQGAGLIRTIRVEGTQRIDPATVRSYMVLNPGDPFDATRVNQSLKSLYATGLFSDVRMRREGQTLVVEVVENPVINRIAIEGNNRIDDETLEAEIQLRPRVVYTRTRVQADVKRILDVYRRNGRYAARVEPKVIQLDQNRVDLVFEVDEGEETGLRKIAFVGNRAFSDSELRGEIASQESAWWAFYRGNDTYDPDRTAFDQELLRRFYLREGYADFRVVSAVAELTPDEEDFILTFTIEEGERYRFGQASVETRIDTIDLAPIQAQIEHQPGEWYDAERVEQTVTAITDAAGNQGFAFVDVRPRVDKNDAERIVNITYEIGEGPKVFVERIDIRGNFRTEDRVIRREFRLVEGDAFNTSKLRRSRQRIQNLGFFSNVEVRTVEGSTPERTVIEVDVEEQSTGELSFGLGFSTAEGVLGDVSIRERNLLGKGQELRLAFTGSTRSQQIDLGFTEPYLFGRPIAGGFDVFRISRDQQDESSFDEDELGFRLRSGYQINERLSQSWSYSLRQVDITNVGTNASRFIRSQQGENVVSEVGQSLLYDQRNNRFRPTEGYFARLSTDFAGIGGDVTFLRNSLEGGYYYPLTDSVTLSAQGEIGVITGLGEDVRLADRFFVGGTRIRGFANSGIGPRDINTDDALGGEQFAVGTLEATFPLGFPEELGVLGRAFGDVGTLTGISDSGAGVEDSGSIRASVGLGVAWNSPFGPINLDYGFPVLKEDYDETENFRISFGTSF